MKKAGLLMTLTGLLASWPSTPGALQGITIVQVPSASVSISNASVEIKEGKLEVTGRVSRWHPLRLPGHIEVSVFRPDGNLLGYNRVQLPQIMSQLPKPGCIIDPPAPFLLHLLSKSAPRLVVMATQSFVQSIFLRCPDNYSEV